MNGGKQQYMSIQILNVVGGIRAKISKEKSKLEKLKSLIGNCTKELDGLPHAKSYSSSVEVLAMKITDSENAIELLENVMQVCVIELSDWLEERLENMNEFNVIFKRYGLCKPFKLIAADLGYSERMIYRFHRTALEKICSCRYRRVKADDKNFGRG